jgi:hypothetical protein
VTGPTDRLPVPRPRPRASPAGRVLRAVSGVLAGGLVALAVGLVAAWYLASGAGVPGPGAGVLVGHGLAAVAAVVAQVRADRRPDGRGALAAWVVVALAAAVLVLQWWW